MPCKFELDNKRVLVDGVEVPYVRRVDVHVAVGEVPTAEIETLVLPGCLTLDDTNINIKANIATIQQACAVLLAEYRNDADFRKAVIDSITDVTADVGLSERIADRLFDMETEYADSTTRDT